MQDREENMDIRDKLKNLPRIKARENFENLLQQKINLADADLQKKADGLSISSAAKKGFFEKLFGKKSLYWTIPAFGSVVVILILLMIYNYNRKIELSPNIPEIQSETTAPKNDMGQSDKIKTGDLNSEKDKISGKDITKDLNTVKEKETDKLEDGKGYLKPDVTIPSPAPAPPTMKNEDFENKKAEEVESSRQPVYQDRLKTDKKAEEKISPDKPVEEKSADEQNDMISVPTNKKETGKERKVKAMEKKKVESKVNRAVKDSTDTIKKELEKIRDSILEKEKNK